MGAESHKVNALLLRCNALSCASQRALKTAKFDIFKILKKNLKYLLQTQISLIYYYR